MKKKIKIDGKEVIYFNKKKTPSKKVIKKTYRKIHDNKNIPVMFMTREQYLKQYIKNQELIKNIDFPEKQEQAYIDQEMLKYKNYLSRYTTKKNKFFPPAVVFFNDKKIPPKQFRKLAFHEYGHEIAEKKNLNLGFFEEEMFADKIQKRKMRKKR